MKKTLFIFIISVSSLIGQNVGVNIGIPEFNLDVRSLDVSTRAFFQLSTPLKENFIRLTSSSSLNTKAVIGRSASDDLSFGIYTPSLIEQMRLSTTGNLSIGTNDTGDKLSIKSVEGDGTNASLRIANFNPPFGDDYLLVDADEMDSYSLKGLKLQSRSASGVEMVTGGGGVGINISPVPFYKLHVFGDELDYQFVQQAPAPFLISSPGPSQGFNFMVMDGNDIMTLDEPLILNGTALHPVVVGGAIPATGYLLSVHGKVMAEEVRVQLVGAWPDYVFEENYELMPLDQLRNFLDKENHLPGIPSASKVEDVGILLGEMQRKTMEKVEEAFLYILELQDQITQLQIENRELKMAINK